MNKLAIAFLALVLLLGGVPAFAAPNSNANVHAFSAVGSYNLSITSGPNVLGRDVALNGTAGAVNYLGSMNQYGIVVIWGDNTQTVFPSLSALGFSDNGTDFSGVWSAQHTYAYPGSYNVQVNLYRNSPSSQPEASDSGNASVVCYPDFPPFYAPC